MVKVALADRVFLVAEDALPQHVACLGILTKPKGAPDGFTQTLVDRLREQRSFATPFNYRLSRPALKSLLPAYDVLPDDEIDLDYHLRLDALPAPGTERQLGVLVSRLHSQRLDLTRPLWEFHVIDGLENDRFAIYLKIHHALMDGVAGATRLTMTLTSDPADRSALALWSVGPRRRDARRAVASRTATALEGARTFGGLLKAGAAIVRDRGSSTPDLAVPFVAPRTFLNGRIGEQRRVATQTYDLARVKAVANSGGVSLNDVFLAIASGSLRRYLSELDDLPPDSLTAGTPVSVRVQGDAGTTNAFTMTVMKLASDIEDPVERLRAISRSSAAAKQNLDGMAKGVLVNYASLFMGPFIAANRLGIAGRTTPPYNVVVSNVPGPTDPAYWSGATLDSMAPLAIPYHGVGLFIAALTVSGSFCVGLVGDRDQVPHLQRIAVYMGDALAELETALSPPT